MLTATQKEYKKISSLCAAYFRFIIKKRPFTIAFEPFLFLRQQVICLNFAAF